MGSERTKLSYYLLTILCFLGIIPRAVKWLFQQKSRGIQFRMRVSYIEIYNERLKDLLNSEPVKQTLDVRENAKGQIMVPNLTQIEVSSVEEVLEVLW